MQGALWLTLPVRVKCLEHEVVSGVDESIVAVVAIEVAVVGRARAAITAPRALGMASLFFHR